MFFLIPVAVDYRARRLPAVTFTLIGLNVLLYLISFLFDLAGRSEIDPLTMNLGLIPAEKTWWTWITSIFIHAGFIHVAGNMIYLFLFGACVEDILGRLRFTIFYLAGGLIANLSQVLLTTEAEAEIPIVGASGAICASIGAFLIVLPRTKINFRYFGWVFFRVFSGEFWLSARVVVAFWFVMDFVSLILHLGRDSGGGGIAFGAHVGGTVAGAFVAWIMRKRLKPADSDEVELRPLASARTAPQPVDIYLYVNEQQIGPFARGRIREMLALGTITPETQYWREGMSEWRPIAEL
ncbi:MAG TPA: rhomboid family intramembrane serine protease [Candidatus Angelobacter sp.]|nr:rhomboid family intramembrane serine protease [Candidatus Angelobacter sp.]